MARAMALASGELEADEEQSPELLAARESFEAFCSAMGKPNAPHHKEWIQELVTEQDSSRLIRIAGDDTNILCPRGSGKSVVMGLFIAWAIGVHTAAKALFRVLYLSYSIDVARSKSFAIKNIIASRKYQEIFPMVRLSKARTSDELWAIDFEYADIELNGDDGYTMVAQGLGGSITSRRADFIAFDDVIKSRESIMNPDIRQKLVTNYREVVRPCLLDGGRAVSLGTRFLPDDIHGTTFTVKYGWRVVRQQAIQTTADGMEASYWEEMWSLAYLRKLRSEDPVSFSFQFMNQPVSKSEIDFPEDWLKLGTLCESYDALAVGIDLSTGLKERNDWTVFTLAGLVDDRVEFIDYRRMRVMGNLEKLDELCEMLADWGILMREESADPSSEEIRYLPTDTVVTCNPEGISYQQSLKADAVSVLHRERNLYNVIFKTTTSMRGDKLTRLRGCFGLFQRSKVIWNRVINWEPYWNELLNFGVATNDDCPDSMVLTLKALLGPGPAETDWSDGWRA